MKATIPSLTCFLSCLALSAQEIAAPAAASAAVTESADAPAPQPVAIVPPTTLTPRLLHAIPDGTPPPPAPPKPPFIVAPEHVRDTKTIWQDGRTVTYQRVDPLPIPPPPEPATPPTAAETAAFAARIAAYRATRPRYDFLMLGATLYLSENHPPRAFIRLWPTTAGAAVSFWSNLDLRETQGISRFVGTDGTVHEVFMIWSAVNIDRAAQSWARRGLAYRPPAFPAFPHETPAAADRPAALAGPASYLVAGDGPADPALVARFAEFVRLCNIERPALHAAFISREKARLALEAELKAHPPRPQDITIHYWTSGGIPVANAATGNGGNP